MLYVEVKAVEFNLIVSYFDRTLRIHEFHRCFQENIRNKHIKCIYVLYEDFRGNVPWFLNDSKIKIVPLDHYPIHKDFYDFANKHLSGELVIWANADIFFDDTLVLLEKVNFKETAVILTRWQVPEYTGKWKRHVGSHDCWIFKAPIKYENGNVRINWFGNESAILHELQRNWPKIINPSLSVKAWHVHLSDFRRPDVLKGCYHLGYPSSKIPFSAIK